MNTPVTAPKAPAATNTAPLVLTREEVDVNVNDYLLADLKTNIYLVFRQATFTTLEDLVLAFQDGENVCELSPFNPMHFTKNGERGIITKNFLPMLESIQTIANSTIRAGEASEIEKCYVAMSKTVENHFSVASWFRGVTCFDRNTRKPVPNVPKEIVPTVRMSLDKVTDEASGVVHYETNIIVTVNFDPTYCGEDYSTVLAYAASALVKLRKKTKEFTNINLFVGITDDCKRVARLVNGLMVTENNSVEDDEHINYYVMDGNTQTEETFTYVDAYNKIGPFPEDRKSRDAILKRNFLMYAKA